MFDAWIKGTVIDLGVRETPANQLRARLSDFARRRYGFLTFSDLKRAFELALVGELEAETEHYNSFDLKYLARILNAYNKKRKGVIFEANEKKELEAPEATESQKAEIHRAFVANFKARYEDLLAGRPISSTIYNTATYELLKRLRLCAFNLEQLREIYRHAEKQKALARAAACRSASEWTKPSISALWKKKPIRIFFTAEITRAALSELVELEFDITEKLEAYVQDIGN